MAFNHCDVGLSRPDDSGFVTARTGKHLSHGRYRARLVRPRGNIPQDVTSQANRVRVMTIADGHEPTLTMLNTYIRRIDLLSKLGAPVSLWRTIGRQCSSESSCSCRY